MDGIFGNQEPLLELGVIHATEPKRSQLVVLLLERLVQKTAKIHLQTLQRNAAVVKYGKQVGLEGIVRNNAVGPVPTR